MYVPSNSEVLGSSDTPAAHYFPARISLQLDGSAHQSLLQATLCILQRRFSQVQWHCSIGLLPRLPFSGFQERNLVNPTNTSHSY